MTRLVLLGAGHAHLRVLDHFMQVSPPDTELILVTPSPWQYYSGMIPGWVAGHYALEQCRIAVAPLVKAAGGRLITDSVVSIRGDRQQVYLAGGGSIDYDLLSVDIGASTQLAALTDYSGTVLSIKPLDKFQSHWQALMHDTRVGRCRHLAILGGGAAGTELAMAVAQRLSQQGIDMRLRLVTGDAGLLPGFNRRMQHLAKKQIARLGIELIEQDAIGRGQHLQLTDGTSVQADAVLAATGARAMPLLATSDLALDEEGFMRVDAWHRSCSHPQVFAVGDVCSRADITLNRSGVHAIRGGQVLAKNLQRLLVRQSQSGSMKGARLRPFKPRPFTLYLLSCGAQFAIGSYGPLTLAGAWVWRLKDRIDRGFVSGFASRSREARDADHPSTN